MGKPWKRKKDRRDRNKPYYITYTTASGKRRTVVGCTDKAKSEEIQRKLEADVQLEIRGIIDPAHQRITDQSRRPAAEHVEEFLRELTNRRAQAHSKRYLSQVRARLTAVIDETGILALTDLSSERVSLFIAQLRGRELSGNTINEYIGTLKSFTRWCAQTSRLRIDPLSMLSKQNTSEIEKTRPRRALLADDVGSLLAAARMRPEYELRTIRRGKNAGKQVAKLRPRTLERAQAKGVERSLAYLLAIWTGLRRSELAALEWRDIRLDTHPAQILLRAVTTKSKRADSIALHPQIAQALRDYRPENAQQEDRVLVTVPGMKVLKADLLMAGISFKTDAGRVDLHSLRTSLGTYLSAHGVPLRLAQAHLRHTDPRLTANIYTDERSLPVAAAIIELPSFPTEPAPARNPLRMTGTDPTVCKPRAAHAQRAQRSIEQESSTACSDNGTDDERKTQTPLDGPEKGGATEHEEASKRVMGFEPTTFTLAT